MNPELQNPEPDNTAEKPVSYTPEPKKRDDIPALEQHNYIQDRQPTYMRVSVNEQFNKKSHRHWISNLIFLFLFILIIGSGFYWWTNMDGRYFFRLVQLSTYSNSNISIALPKNYQIEKSQDGYQQTIKYFRDNAGDKVLAIQLTERPVVDSAVNLRDISKTDKEKNNMIVNILTNYSDGLYYLTYDVKKIDVIAKRIKEVYFTGKTKSYELTFYDDMTDSDFTNSISYIISTLEIK